MPDDALYEFALVSDDGSSMDIGDRTVVDNDGFHGDEQRTGMIALRAGSIPSRFGTSSDRRGVADWINCSWTPTSGIARTTHDARGQDWQLLAAFT